MGDVITIGLDIAKSVFQVQKAGRPTLVVYGDETPTRSRAEIESMAALPNIAQRQTVPAWGISGRSRFCHPTVSFSREQAPSARLCPWLTRPSGSSPTTSVVGNILSYIARASRI